MTFDYNKARAIAKAIIDKFGKSGTFVKSGENGGYDDFGNPLPNQPDIVINGIVTPLLQYKKNEIDGQNILMGDNFVFFDADTKPEVDHQHTQNGETFRVVDIYDLTSVDGINVFLKIQLRK